MELDGIGDDKMLTIDLTDIPDSIEEKDKFKQYMENILDAFRVDSESMAELKVATDDSHKIYNLYYAICDFLITHANDDPDTLVIVRNDKGKLILRKIRDFWYFIEDTKKIDRSGDAQNI